MENEWIIKVTPVARLYFILSLNYFLLSYILIGHTSYQKSKTLTLYIEFIHGCSVHMCSILPFKIPINVRNC